MPRQCLVFQDVAVSATAVFSESSADVLERRRRSRYRGYGSATMLVGSICLLSVMLTLPRPREVKMHYQNRLANCVWERVPGTS